MANGTRNKDEMSALGETFPSLRGAPGVRPWAALRLSRYAARKNTPAQAKFAARFLLAVWNPRVEWVAGPFDIKAASECWDAEHRAAFVAWVNAQGGK